VDEAGAGAWVGGGEGGGGAVDFWLGDVADELGLHDECRHAAAHVLHVDQLLQIGTGPSHLGCVEIVLFELLHDEQVDQLVFLEVALAFISDLLDVARKGHLYVLLQELFVGK
jgi:hypothetical protein